VKRSDRLFLALWTEMTDPAYIGELLFTRQTQMEPDIPYMNV